MEWGTKKVIEIFKTKPFSNYIDKMYEGNIETEEKMREYIKNTVQVLYQYVMINF